MTVELEVKKMKITITGSKNQVTKIIRDIMVTEEYLNMKKRGYSIRDLAKKRPEEIPLPF